MPEAPSPRVLLFCGPAAGGLRRHVDQLAARLPALGYQVAVAAPEAVRLEADIPRFPVELGDRPRPRNDLAALRALRRAAREWQADLVHCHGVKAALLGLAALGWSRTPVVVTFHNLWGGGPLWLPMRVLLPFAEATVCVSDAVRVRLAGAKLPLLSCHIIPNGVDLTQFTPAPAVPPDPFTVAFAGRLTQEKGLPTLLATAERLARDEVPIRFLIAGDGPLREQVETHPLVAAGMVNYLGQLTDVQRVYHAAHALVVPSYSEGQGLAALEAMACGLPVVANWVGGLSEVIVEGETGLFPRSGFPRELAGVLSTLAEDRARAAALGRNGRLRVEREFSLERMLQRLDRLYQETLPRQG